MHLSPTRFILRQMKTSRLPIALQQAVMRCLREKLRMANQFFGTDYTEPEITYQQRGTSAGSAYLQHWQIRLNPVLLMENQQPFIDEVIPHELAHLLVYRRFGRAPAPHGKEWRWMMEHVLGVSASRTHKFEVASVQSKTYPYLCACRDHQLTVRRHNKVMRKESEYRCRHCGELLRFNAKGTTNC
ncbi:SprT protein [Rahnella sp. JUb53]|nr:SprT protein [Rahnella sp. JUb53]